MKSFVPFLALSILLLGCSGPIIKTMVEPHGETIAAKATTNSSATIPGLRQRIQETTDRTVIFFVHGMDDTCPGYALDERLGWFSSKVSRSIGLKRSEIGKADDTLIVPDHENSDSNSTLVVQRNRYTVGNTDKRVDAIEITWSGLDRWLKDNQLGYDISALRLPSPPPDKLNPGDEILNCVKPVGGTFSQWRVPVNRYFKDGLMDRKLADVVIYSGSYGAKIEREVADALCRTLKDDWSQNDANNLCDWSTVPSDPPMRFMFVTHSLGSRIVYDTLLELLGQRMRPDTVVFKNGEPAQAHAAISQLLARTMSIYMMANQLPILGLAYAQPEMTSEDGGVRLIKLAKQISLNTTELTSTDSGLLSQSTATTTKEQWTRLRPVLATMNSQHSDLLVGLIIARRDALFQPNSPAIPGMLDIVAFNDPNDLLSYSLPDWYGGVAGIASIRITNVFVHNATRWFWLIENPATAHTGYITNEKEVWNIITCGVTRGIRSTCEPVN